MKAKKYIRILCEGEKTEPNYFRGIIKVNRILGAQIVKPKDNSPFSIVKLAKEEIRKARRAKIPKSDIEVWAVFDKDQHANLPNAISMALDNNIKVAFSNIVFRILDSRFTMKDAQSHFKIAMKLFNIFDNIMIQII